ncbi:ATP-binding protein [Streptomyces bobili]|uniref:ATP-binding protein n=1 Tax=Streptomyces bobili TaxID=67280 RepID=UPI003817C139
MARRPRRARELVLVTGRLWRVSRTVRQDLKLITSELTTNAVLYAPGPTLTVALFRSADQARVVVGGARPPPRHAGRLPGRGLLLARSLADRFTVQSRGTGTVAAAFLRLPPALPRAEDDVDAARSHPGSGDEQ